MEIIFISVLEETCLINARTASVGLGFDSISSRSRLAFGHSNVCLISSSMRTVFSAKVFCMKASPSDRMARENTGRPVWPRGIYLH